MASRVTLNDIAAAANVSKATVSKALNDTGQLSARTRRVVLAAAGLISILRRAAERLKRRAAHAYFDEDDLI